MLLLLLVVFDIAFDCHCCYFLRSFLILLVADEDLSGVSDTGP